MLGAAYRDNWELSLARAMSVVRRLLRDGVSEEQLSAVGKGEFMPANNENSSDARAQNRRVEIVVTPKLGEIHKIHTSGV